MSTTHTTQERETATGNLFGQLFPAYDDRSFLHSMSLFAERFRQNGFPLDWFAGKTCLDAGCGGGRYAMAMAALRAEAVTGIDLGDPSLVDARRRANAMGLANVKFMSGTVQDLPFPDAAFDCVVFSGVLQHTSEPCRALDEVTRVLRPGGMIYMLVYATEGLRWPLVQMLRPTAALLGLPFMDRAVARAGLPVNQRRTYLDDLFVPYIDFYSWPCLRGMLAERGLDRIDRWTAGRLDHEEDLAAYGRDLQGFRDLFQAACILAEEEQLSAAPLLASSRGLIEAAVVHIETIACQHKLGRIAEPAARELAIGQGHHRVVAWKP